MKQVTFITGNQNKADHLAKFLGHPVSHQKIDLDEIQSLDLKEVVEHKVRQAYEKMKTPVLVEDSGVVFNALGRLPGPFIKFFVKEISLENVCRLLDGKDRSAFASVVYGYFDGQTLKIIEGGMRGTIADAPQGDGWDWDKIFIPEGFNEPRAMLSEDDYRATSFKIRPFEQLKTFLETL